METTLVFLSCYGARRSSVDIWRQLHGSRRSKLQITARVTIKIQTRVGTIEAKDLDRSMNNLLDPYRTFFDRFQDYPTSWALSGNNTHGL